MNDKNEAGRLREAAERALRLSRSTTDKALTEKLKRAADEYSQRADAVERSDNGKDGGGQKV